MNRFSKIKSVFLKDLNWKIFSIVVAIFLWIMVINVKNPIETRKYTVPLTVRSEEFLAEQGYYINNLDKISDTTVTLTVRGERNSLDTLSKLKESISAYVNLSKCEIDAEAGTASCYIETSLPIGSRDTLEIVSQNIVSVVFNIEEFSSRELEISVIFPDELEGSYLAANVVVNPEKVTVSGPKSFVDSIKNACVYYNDKNGGSNNNRPIFVYNASGKEVENITLDIEEADIIVPEKEEVAVEFSANYTGNPAEGFAVSSVEINNVEKEFFTYGGTLRQAVINLPDIDIEGKSEDVSEVFNVMEYLPETIEISESSDPDVEVVIKIGEAEGNTYSADISQLNVMGLKDGYDIEFDAEILSVMLEGSADSLSQVDPADIVLNLNIDECVEGEFVSYAEAQLPEGSMVRGGADVGYRIVMR